MLVVVVDAKTIVVEMRDCVRNTRGERHRVTRAARKTEALVKGVRGGGAAVRVRGMRGVGTRRGARLCPRVCRTHATRVPVRQCLRMSRAGPPSSA